MCLGKTHIFHALSNEFLSQHFPEIIPAAWDYVQNFRRNGCSDILWKAYFGNCLTRTDFKHQDNSSNQYVLHPKILDTLAQLRLIKIAATKCAAHLRCTCSRRVRRKWLRSLDQLAKVLLPWGIRGTKICFLASPYPCFRHCC